MKILIASTFYHPYICGGAEISTQIMAEGLAERGHAVEIVTTGEKDEIVEYKGVVIHRFNFKDSKIALSTLGLERQENVTKVSDIMEIYREFFFSPYFYNKYYKLLKEGRYDLAHASGNLYCLGRYSFWSAAKSLGIPMSQALRDPKLCHLDFCGGILDRYISWRSKKAISKMCSIVAPSQYMLDYYKRRKIVHLNSVVIPNAVDIEFVNPQFSMKENQILYVGRISKEKGLLTLIQAIKQMKVRCKCLIVGSGSYLDGIELPCNVVKVGFLERNSVYELMQLSKIVVLPSEWPEAFGRTVIESIANGTICIGSDSGAIPEILDSHYIFKTGCIEALSELLDKVISYNEEMYLNEIEYLQNTCDKYKKQNYIINWERYFEYQMERKNCE